MFGDLEAIKLIIIQTVFGPSITASYSLAFVASGLIKVPLKFTEQRTRSSKRIGPHNLDLLSILIGSLLGDAHAERHGLGTRFCFQQEDIHRGYLLWFHDYLAKLGYCRSTLPVISSRIGNKGKLRYLSRFKTFTYSSFNWIHDDFYINRVKVIPESLGDYLTPLALAVWIMDDGGKVSKGLKLATNSFSHKETEFLAKLLRDKFDLKTSVISGGAANQYNIYISKSSMKTLADLVKPFMHKTMYYKLNGYL